MFRAKCTQCGRSFLFDSESTGNVRCCKTQLGKSEPHTPPTPRPSTPRKDNRRFGKNKLLPCVYRGEQAGEINCGCQGTRSVHRCTKLIRPTAAHEPAYCVMYRPVKYFGITLTDGSKIDAHEVPLSEIVVCQPGKCDLYQPAVR